jgi:hypothetical protein
MECPRVASSMCDHDLAIRLIRIHQAVRILNLFETKNLCWLRTVGTVRDAIEYGLERNVRKGKGRGPAREANRNALARTRTLAVN